MRRTKRQQTNAFLFAGAAVVVATLVRVGAAYLFATDAPFLLFVGAVAAAAWFGGFAPGIFGTVLAIASMHFLRGPETLPPEIIGSIVRFSLFALVCVVVSATGEASLRYRRRLEAERRRLQEELALRKAGEAKLDRLYAQLRLVTDHAPVLIAHCDTTHRYKFVNKSYADGFGLPPDALVGKSMAEVLGPDVYREVEPHLSAVLKGQHVQYELRMPSPENGERNVHIAYAPEFDESGRVAGYVAAVTDVTAHKRTEEELRINQERLDLAQKAAGVGIFEWDIRTGRSIWTPALEALHGYPPGGYDGSFEEWQRRVHPDDWSYVEVVVERARNEKIDPVGEYRIIRLDGEVRWLASLGKVITNDRGEVVRLVGVNVDITERKNAERLLRQRERMLAQSQQMAHVGGWELDLVDLTDMNRNPLRWTDESYRLFGFEPGSVEVNNQLFFELVHPNDRVQIVDAVLESLRRNVPYEIEHRIVRNDGNERVIHQWGTFVYASDGRPIRIIGTMQDVTERRRMEETVRASEQQFRLLADAMPQIAWITDATGRVTYINQRWQDYTGLRLAQSQIDTLLQSVIHPEDMHGMMQAWQQCMATGEDYEHQVRFKRASDGAFRWFLSRGVSVRDKHGAITQWFGTATDIDDQKRMERTLREADRRKDEFLATLAHELRNPLAPIRHGLHLLRMPRATSATREQARHMMERQVGQMARLIDDLIDISRISRGTLDLRKDWIELGALVQAAVETSNPLIQAAGHTLTVSVPTSSVLLSADFTRLAQVFSNLLNNAAKYTPTGGHIELRAEHRDGEVIVRVKDSGIGIPADKLATVFDMFVQLDRSLEAARGGLGVGLTLAKRLVEMHSGRLEARSDGPGTGAEFIVRLPMVRLPADHVDTPAPVSCADESETATSVLIVDDNVDSAESLSAVLRLMGYETATAHDGMRGLELAEKFRPDVVLLDIGMPRLNGYDTARELRATPWGKDALLIALTGWGQEADKQRATEAGFDHHITKPLDPALLPKLLAQRGRRMSKPAALVSEYLR